MRLDALAYLSGSGMLKRMANFTTRLRAAGYRRGKLGLLALVLALLAPVAGMEA
jgi:hypothetical protein